MSRNEWVLVAVAVACSAVASSKAVLSYSVWITVVGVLAGGAITALFSWYFYKRAGDELREEAANLRHYVNAVLSKWEREGYEVPRDPETGTPYARVRKDLVLKWRTDADAGSAGEDSPPRSGTPDPQEDARRPW